MEIFNKENENNDTRYALYLHDLNHEELMNVLLNNKEFKYMINEDIFR